MAKVNLVFAIAAFLVAGFAQARELRIDRAVHNAIWAGGWKQNTVDDVEFYFSKAPDGTFLELGAPVTASGYARPYIMQNGNSFPRDDGRTCDEALRNTLLELAQLARKQGAYAVVNITSSFLETPFDSPTHFACNAGRTSAVVELAAQFAKLKVPPEPGVKRGRPDQRIFPPASKFAAIDDINAIPYLQANCKKFYVERFLRAPFPRAFAISTGGRCSTAAGYFPAELDRPQDPAARALAVCKTNSGNTCQLYAVDNRVVFKHVGLEENDLLPVAISE
jgi:hypothetical protein